MKLPEIPSAHLFENHIVYQMENVVGGLANKSKDHIEGSHQDGKLSEIIYCGLTNFKQSQDSQLKNNDMMVNHQVKFISSGSDPSRSEMYIYESQEITIEASSRNDTLIQISTDSVNTDDSTEFKRDYSNRSVRNSNVEFWRPRTILFDLFVFFSNSIIMFVIFESVLFRDCSSIAESFLVVTIFNNDLMVSCILLFY